MVPDKSHIPRDHGSSSGKVQRRDEGKTHLWEFNASYSTGGGAGFRCVQLAEAILRFVYEQTIDEGEKILMYCLM